MTETEARGDTVSYPPSGLMAPSDARTLAPGIAPSGAQLGWLGAAIWPDLRLINSELLWGGY